MTKFAERFGGKPDDYSRCVYALMLLSHGAATLLSLPSEEIARDEVRRNFMAISETLIKQTKLFRG